MKIVSYSGGLGSFMAAYLVRNENAKLIFTDTKTEDPDLYRFLNETSKALGMELITLADGRNIWEVFESVKFMGNSRIDPCSRVLKRELFRDYVDKNYSIENDSIVFGIDHRESHRMDTIAKRWAPWKTEAPLCQTKLNREDILDALDSLGIEPPKLYEMGFPHNNCGGFCVKTGQKQMALLFSKMPERYKWHEEQQEKLFAKIGSNHGFIRRTEKGEMKYLSLKQFREFLESGGAPEMWNQEGCGCFV